MGQTYGSDMRKAARRHLEAGEQLYDGNRRDVAGYIYGLAAECALKQIMVSSGMRPLPESERREDPFYAHFEELKTMLRNSASGRFAAEIRRYVEQADFLQHWDVSMRYSHGRDIQPGWIDKWRHNARELISKMDEV